MQGNELFEQNAEFIRKHRKNIDVESLNELTEGYEVSVCADEKSYTISKHTESGLLRLHSLYEPEREGLLIARKYIEVSSIGSAFVCYGFGLGYVHKHLVQLLEDHGFIIIIEPNYEIFNYYVRLFDVREILENEKIFLIICEDTKELEAILRRRINSFSVQQMEFKFSLVYQRLFPQSFQAYLGILKEIMVSTKITQNTFVSFGKQWIKNQLESLPVLAYQHCASAFFGTLEGRTAVLVSAGPSLDKNVHLLRQLKGKIFIIASYSCIRILTELGIEPDMYCSLDAKQLLYTLPQGGSSFDTPLVCVSITNSEVVANHKGSKIVPLIAADNMLRQLFCKIEKQGNIIDSGASVACFMLSFLKNMGVKTAVLIGQDLAFTGGKHHAEAYLRGQSHHKVNNISEMEGGGIIYVEDIYGGKVATSNVFNTYLEWFNNFVTANKELCVVDATEGGAKINGTQIMKFSEAIDTYMDGEPRRPLGEVLDEAYSGKRFFEVWELPRVREVFGEVQAGLLRVLDVIDEGIEVARAMVELCERDVLDKASLNAVLEHLDGIDRVLNAQAGSIRFLATAFYQQLVHINRLRGRDENEGVYLGKRTLEMYEGLKDVCEYAAQLMEHMLVAVWDGGEARAGT